MGNAQLPFDESCVRRSVRGAHHRGWPDAVVGVREADALRAQGTHPDSRRFSHYRGLGARDGSRRTPVELARFTKTENRTAGLRVRRGGRPGLTVPAETRPRVIRREDPRNSRRCGFPRGVRRACEASRPAPDATQGCPRESAGQESPVPPPSQVAECHRRHRWPSATAVTQG